MFGLGGGSVFTVWRRDDLLLTLYNELAARLDDEIMLFDDTRLLSLCFIVRVKDLDVLASLFRRGLMFVSE